jgi:sugar phosphate isomerase/epimerase
VTSQAAARQLVLAHFSIRNASFEQRCAAAAGAGFDGFGLYIGEYSRLRAAGRSDDDLLAVVAAHGTRVVELEALPFFVDHYVDTFVHLVATFRPDRVQVVPPFSGDVDRAEAARWLGALADRVAPFGTTLAIEFLPITAVANAADAAELVDRAGRPNIGLCVDAWHVFRGDGLLSLVGLDPNLVTVVQFDDGSLDPVLDDYVQDCLHHREVPGEGEFDLRGLLALLPADAPISVEVPDDDLDRLDPGEVAMILHTETLRYVG